MSLVIAHGNEQLGCRFQVITNLADGCEVSALTAVVWRTPQSDLVVVLEMIFVALFD